VLREILSATRGFFENAAFVGGAVITWFADPFAAETSRGPWWYGPLVFVVCLALSILLTGVIIAVDKTEATRRAGDQTERQKLLLTIEADVKSLTDQIAKVQLPQVSAAASAPQVAGKTA
jgi:hypothetical protein